MRQIRAQNLLLSKRSVFGRFVRMLSRTLAKAPTVLRRRAADVALEEFGEVISIFVADMPGDLVETLRGRSERKLCFGNAPFNNVVDGRYPLFACKFMSDIAH